MSKIIYEKVFASEAEAMKNSTGNVKKVMRDGHTFVLISKNPEPCSQAYALVKALLLTVAAIATVCTSKGLLKAFCEEWDAAFSGNYLTKRYRPLKNTSQPSACSDVVITPKLGDVIITGTMRYSSGAIGLVGAPETCRSRLSVYNYFTLPGGKPFPLTETDVLFEVEIRMEGKLTHAFVPGDIFEGCVEKITLEYKGKAVELALDPTFKDNFDDIKKRCYLGDKGTLYSGCGDIRGMEALKRRGGPQALTFSEEEVYRTYQSARAFKLNENGEIVEVPYKKITWELAEQRIIPVSFHEDVRQNSVWLLEIPCVERAGIDITFDDTNLCVYGKFYEESGLKNIQSDFALELLSEHPELRKRGLTPAYQFFNNEFFTKIQWQPFFEGKSYEEMLELIRKMTWEIFTNGILKLTFPKS